MQWAAQWRGSFFPFVLIMAFAILRVEKIKSAANAAAKTGHNYRLHAVPNADASRQPLNQELVNHTQRPLWELAEVRVAELGLKRLRADAVKAVEVLLTASPEAFPRDAQGQAVDMRGSAWLAANQQFLTERFGVANVVALTLHQDEQTPHLHAVVVPATADGRLSARDVFNPASLRQLQTDYTQAMQAAGFQVQRGIEGSTAKHESVRAYYGALQAGAEQVATPPEQLLVAAAAGLHAQQRNLVQQQRLVAAHAVKEQTFEQLQAERKEREVKETALNTWAVRYVQGNDMSQFKKGGERHREEAREKLVTQLTQALVKPQITMEEIVEGMKAEGYNIMRSPSKSLVITHQLTGAHFEMDEVQPNGKPLLGQLTAVKQARDAEAQAKLQQTQAPDSETQPRIRGPRLK
jgi:organic hydroperoxide reductase OsmC/OhrA